MSPSCLEAAIGKRIPLPTIQGPQRCAKHFRASFPARCCHCHGGCLIEHAKSTVRRGPSKTRAALDWNGFVIPQQQPTPCSDESSIGLSLIMASREPVWGPPRIRATTDSFGECQDMPLRRALWMVIDVLKAARGAFSSIAALNVASQAIITGSWA